MIVPGIFVCSSFLISVCMFIVSKALLISSATVIVRAGLCVALLMDLFVLRVCELFGETIRNMFGCVCYFVVESDGVVVCGWRCSIG